MNTDDTPLSNNGRQAEEASPGVDRDTSVTADRERDLAHLPAVAQAIRRAAVSNQKTVVLSLDDVRDDLLGAYASIAFADQCGVILVFSPSRLLRGSR